MEYYESDGDSDTEDQHHPVTSKTQTRRTVPAQGWREDDDNGGRARQPGPKREAKGTAAHYGEAKGTALPEREAKGTALPEREAKGTATHYGEAKGTAEEKRGRKVSSVEEDDNNNYDQRATGSSGRDAAKQVSPDELKRMMETYTMTERVRGTFELAPKATASTVPTIDPTDIFTKLVQQCQGKAPPSKVRRFFPHGYSNDNIIQWFRERNDQFIVYENDNGVVSGLSVRIRGLRLCQNYNSRNGCRHQFCQFVHICTHFVMGYCMKEGSCDRSHNFHNERNTNVLLTHGLKDFDSNDLLFIMRISIPQACYHYNGNQCTRASSCQYFHLCRGFIMNRCQLPDCRFAHDFDSPHSQRLLKLFDLDQERNVSLIKKNIQFSRLHMSRRRDKSQASDNRGRAQGRDNEGRTRSSSCRNLRSNDEDYGRRETDDVSSRMDKLRLEQLSKPKQQQYSSAQTRDAPGPAQTYRTDAAFPTNPEDIDLSRGANWKSEAKHATSAQKKPVAPVPKYDDFGAGSGSDTASDVNWHYEKSQKLTQRAKPTEDVVHDSGNIEICLQHVASLAGMGKCRKGKNCFDHHVNMVYMWQASLFGEWESLTMENEAIEKVYCNPKSSQHKITVHTAIIGLQGSTLDIKFANEESMKGYLGSTEIPMRRLATKSGRTRDRPTTKWRWFFTMGKGKWVPYEVGDEKKLEDAYQAGKTLVELQTGSFRYKVNLASWYQENAQTGTQRDICRRPQSFVNREDVLTKQWGEIKDAPRSTDQDLSQDGTSLYQQLQQQQLLQQHQQQAQPAVNHIAQLTTASARSALQQRRLEQLQQQQQQQLPSGRDGGGRSSIGSLGAIPSAFYAAAPTPRERTRPSASASTQYFAGASTPYPVYGAAPVRVLPTTAAVARDSRASRSRISQSRPEPVEPGVLEAPDRDSDYRYSRSRAREQYPPEPRFDSPERLY